MCFNGAMKSGQVLELQKRMVETLKYSCNFIKHGRPMHQLPAGVILSQWVMNRRND
jgi:hypothetical protein